MRRAVPVITGAARRRLEVAAEPVGGAIDEIPAIHVAADTAEEPETVTETVTAPAPVADPERAAPEALPIEGYDHLAARQVVDRLDSLLPNELASVAAYERAHRHRQTVLRKIDQLRS